MSTKVKAVEKATTCFNKNFQSMSQTNYVTL